MPDKSLTIVFVRRGYSQTGGAEAYLKRLARGVVAAGHRAELITTDDWPPNEWPFGAITHLRARSPIEFADELEQMRSQLRCDVLMSLERIWHCDIYRAGDGVHRAWLDRRRKFEIPLQRFVRGLNHKHRDILRLEEALFTSRGAGRVIVNSSMVKNEIVDLYNYPPDRIDIVRNGVPLEKFRFDSELREKARGDLNLKPDDITLLFVGSGWERKGLRFAIAAMALCRNRKMWLFVAGRGNRRSYKSKHVHFLGEVGPDAFQLVKSRRLSRLLRPASRQPASVVDLTGIYAAADIFILPTIYDPFSNACLEALACGLPVITTRDNGFAEIIKDGIHGSIVDPAHDITRLRDAIRFWSAAERREDARSEIIERASQFDIARNVAQTLEILVQAAASAASTSGKIRNT